MGLLGFLGKAIRSVGSAVGTVVEKIGSALGSTTITSWGAELWARCQFGAKQWNQLSSVENTVDVHKELAKVKNSVEPQARAVEEDLVEECIREVAVAFDSLLPLVPSFELMRLKESYAEQINHDLSDKIMEYIDPRLSMDDPRCTKVLSIADDRERMEASRKYQDSVMSGAVQSFKKDCIKVKNDCIHKIVELAETGLREQERECRQLEQMLSDLLARKMNETQIDMEREKILISIEKISVLQALNNQTDPEYALPRPNSVHTKSVPSDATVSYILDE